MKIPFRRPDYKKIDRLCEELRKKAPLEPKRKKEKILALKKKQHARRKSNTI